MKNHLLLFVLAILCLGNFHLAQAQTDTNHYNYGIWQTFGNPMPTTSVPELRGRLCNFRWADIETAPDVWNWSSFDSDLTSRAKDTLPIIFMIYTEEDAPDWLYTNGVPKVAQKDNNGNLIANAPYYADPTYKSFFKRMIAAVHKHLETLPDSVRKQVIAVQGCFGSTGDYISYKGSVDPQYKITADGFYSLFKEFSQYYYDEYKNTSPKIYLLSNPKNNGADQITWLVQNCPDGWIKTGSLGKGYQLNDEVSKSGWLYPIINTAKITGGGYVRARSEIIGNSITSGWWLKSPYQNMFQLLSYCIYWGVDWSNQSGEQLNDPLFDSAFSFYNKYAGQKDPAKSRNAMCVLKDAIDASDAIRFPAGTYGTVSKTTTRFKKVLAPFIAYGAKLEDPTNAVGTETDNLVASGINDVGWGIFPGNYDRYIHQINANATSAGYWNVESADPKSMYGRFARGFDLANGKNGLYFDVDNSFLGNTPLNAQYPVMLEITYLDQGTGSWQLFYDAKDNSNKASMAVKCSNSGLWKKASVTVPDAYFGNRSNNGADFYIKNTGTSDVIFAVVELSRPKADLSDVGYYVSNSLAFDTLCINSNSSPVALRLAGSFLTDSTTTVCPLNGFSFSMVPDGLYTDSLTINGYGATFNQIIYVKFHPSTEGSYNGTIRVKGGGVPKVKIPVTASAVNSSPILSAEISNVTCNNAKNGAITLTTTGGTGAFTFSWKSAGTFKSSSKDIQSLVPDTYTVTVASQAGCLKSASYVITQPDVLITNISADNMICKGGTTKAYVTATGGTLPYTGSGTFSVSAGNNAFTVTDANGCTDRETINIANGTLTAPAKPTLINSDAADATGLCGGGNFTYAVDPVPNATSYTWSLPDLTSIVSKNDDGSSIVLNATANFNGGTISVTADNVCGSSVERTKTITTIPGKPGAISGDASVRASQTQVNYSVPAVAGLTYAWNVPAGAKIMSGQNTSSIAVNWGSTSGNVNVKASNGCGTSSSSSLYVTVSTNLSADVSTNAMSTTWRQPNQLTVFPNPAKDIANISFESFQNADYTLVVSDVSGKLLLRKSSRAERGLNKIVLDVSNYSSGLYLITVAYATGEKTTSKLIKQ